MLQSHTALHRHQAPAIQVTAHLQVLQDLEAMWPMQILESSTMQVAAA